MYSNMVVKNHINISILFLSFAKTQNKLFFKLWKFNI